MTDTERLDILARAQRLGLRGTGGECGETAVAINELLFNGRGALVAALNWPLWQRGRFVGHVGVRVGDSIWDAEGAYDGAEGLEDFLAWGMVDPEDPDYDLTESQSYDARIISVSQDQLRAHLPCGRVNPWALIRAAV